MSTLPAIDPAAAVVTEESPCPETNGKHSPVVIEYEALYATDQKGEKWPYKWIAHTIACIYCDMQFDNKKWVTLRS